MYTNQHAFASKNPWNGPPLVLCGSWHFLIALLKADSEKPPYPFNTLEVSFAWTSVFGRFMLHGTHQDTLSTTPARLSFNVRAGSGLCS